DVFPGEDDRFPRQIGYAPVKTPVELAKERGEELPKRMTLLDASRAARERRLAGEEPKGEVGFNFGQHAGDYVDPDTARELGSTPTNQGKESTDTKRAGAQPDRPAQPSEPAERPTARPAARPATGGGKHHKPDAGAAAAAETSPWLSPCWDEKDRRTNPYALADDHHCLLSNYAAADHALRT
ncbi:cell division protein FtsH, partial [Listeria monocytogenes]